MTGFDPAAEFLLDWQWPNLFEPASAADLLDWRCKGCGEIVPSWEREKHHAAHRRALKRSQRRHENEVREQRRRNLAKARAARAGA